ncbi:MAG: 30S ribosomal protein S9, partial [Candidatus Thermoplasmatota archaeon]|nr:30S ribosomal protein S9 [Candidatus Thermoplasmatota archaeon]
MSDSDSVITVGKRKTAVATAVARKGFGRVRVNNVPIEIVDPQIARSKMMEPLLLAGDRAKSLDIDVDISGGGVMGQAEAARTAIAKGLVSFLKDEGLERIFRQYDRSLLISDPRRKLPKKPGGRG